MEKSWNFVSSFEWEPCWADVEDIGPTLAQHWVNVPYLLGPEVTTESLMWQINSHNPHIHYELMIVPF